MNVAKMWHFLRIVQKTCLEYCISFLIRMYAHAPEQRLVCCHRYGLPEVSMGNRFISVGGAHQFSKLQDLVICGGQEKRLRVCLCILMDSTVDSVPVIVTLGSQAVCAVRRST